MDALRRLRVISSGGRIFGDVFSRHCQSCEVRRSGEERRAASLEPLSIFRPGLRSLIADRHARGDSRTVRTAEGNFRGTSSKIKGHSAQEWPLTFTFAPLRFSFDL